MTKADAQRFAEIWRRLKIAFDAYGSKSSEERMLMFFDDLKAYDIEHVERAFEYHRRHGTTFPKPKDILLALAQTRQVQTVGDMPAFDADNPYHCYGCGDSGFREYWCPGEPDNPEWDPKPWRGRETQSCNQRHYPALVNGQAVFRGHEYVTPCPCRSTNPVLKALRRSGAA